MSNYEFQVGPWEGLEERDVEDVANQSRPLDVKSITRQSGPEGSFIVTCRTKPSPLHRAEFDDHCRLKGHLRTLSNPRLPPFDTTSPLELPGLETSAQGRNYVTRESGSTDQRLPALRNSPTPSISNLRVQEIPIEWSRDKLYDVLHEHGIVDTKEDIRSLERKSESHRCATIIVRGRDVNSLLDQNTSPCHIDDNFMGFTPLYEGDKAVVDVVVVPGLGTHAFTTFRPQGQEEMWLRDFLPKDIPNIRVLLYGYDSHVPKSLNTSGFNALASNLRDTLVNLRKATKTERRPIILLGQSMGGIIIKELLSSAENGLHDPGRDSFTRGIMFFGVPNHGMKNPPLAIMAANQENKRMIIRPLLVTESGQPSNYLVKLHDTFWETYNTLKPRPYLAAYHETMKTPTAVERDDRWTRTGKEELIVSEHSASLPGCAASPLEGDHSTMAKFERRSDDRYQKVHNVLKDWVKAKKPWRLPFR